MSAFFAYTVSGLVTGAIYALLSSGLVVTYTTSGIFNFAHGAIGMLSAFTYWELTADLGVPSWLALLLVLGVLAPGLGMGLERLLIRPLRGAPVDLALVTTMGMLTLMIGVAQAVWNPQVTRRLPQFFLGHSASLPGITITYNQITIGVVAVIVAIALRLLFNRTRMGIAMRAVVDDPDLLAMAGARPARVQQLSWALGASLAGLAGILLAPLVTLDQLVLTLLVINGYAAAMVGRLKSLPLTAAGAVVLGLLQAYDTGYAPLSGVLSFLHTYALALPMVFLFVVLVALPQDRLRVGNPLRPRTPPVPGLGRSVGWAAALVAVAAVLAPRLSPVDLGAGSKAMAVGVVLLSIVLLTGYTGQASLCQFSFLGLGAFAMGHAGQHGSLLGVLAALALCAVIGALVALPTLRLRGLYLALATFAFANAMDLVFFNSQLSASGSLPVARLRLPGMGTPDDRTFFIFLTVIFALAGVGVLALRRSSYGRRLVALNDSPAACATLGININVTKLAVFAAAAALAGLGGVLYGGQQGNIDPNSVVALNSVLALLVLRIGGATTVTGAFVGAVGYAGLAVVHVPHFSGSLSYLFIGLGGLLVGYFPNGIVGALVGRGARLRRRPRLAGLRAALPAGAR